MMVKLMAGSTDGFYEEPDKPDTTPGAPGSGFDTAIEIDVTSGP